MKPQVLVYGFHAPELVPAVQQGLDGDCEIAHWIGVRRPGVHFDHDIVQWHLGNDLNLPENWLNYKPTTIAQKMVACHFERLADQLRRNPFCTAMNQAELQTLSGWLVDMFSELLLKKNIAWAIFQNLPHEGFEFALYLAARECQIPTLLCYQSVIENRFFFCQSLDDFGYFTSCDLTAEVPFELPRQFQKHLFYMENVSANMQNQAEDANRQLARPSSTGRLARRLISGFRKPLALSPEAAYQSALAEVTQPEIDWGADFVYFPLHLQPELTTSAIGDEYVDQLLAIEKLIEWLPENIRVYAKENPKQDHRWRGPDFFARWKKIPRLSMVPRTTSTYRLLEHCRFAATITGTVGWEAITGGKSVLVFGRPWYLTLPGVFHYRDAPLFSVVATYHVDHAKLVQATRELLRRARQGIIDINYRQGYAGFDATRNAQGLAKFFRAQARRVLFANE